MTEIGEVALRVPCDRARTFEPQTVPKCRRRLDGPAANVISSHAKGLTTGEIQQHLAELYGSDVSRDEVSAYPVIPSASPVVSAGGEGVEMPPSLFNGSDLGAQRRLATA